VVLEASKGKKLPADKVKPGGAENEAVLISETNLGSAVYGTAVIANGTVYVQSNTHLFAFASTDKPSGRTDQQPRLDVERKR